MRRRGFSIIELIGALAILAILTALLLPRLSRKPEHPDVFQTVNQAHILEVEVALQSLQAAVTAHLAQFGSLASANGTPLNFAESYDQFGQVLLSEGIIERPFGVRLSTNAAVRLFRVAGYSSSTIVDGLNGAYDLDGDGRNDVVAAAFVVEAVLRDVNEAEARALNDQVDGPRMGVGQDGNDLTGRVIFRKAGTDGRTEVHIYIMRK